METDTMCRRADLNGETEMNKMSAQPIFTEITPGMARAMLAKSDGNRSLKQAKVAAYSRDMAAGDWLPNGETIIFDENDVLIDGHHRLTACIDAGAPFPALIVRGVPTASRKTIDMGASRTSADALGFYGVKNANHVNAIVRILLSLGNGRPRSANPSTQEVFHFLENHDLSEAATFASRYTNIKRVRSILGAIYYVASNNGEADKATAFAEVLNTGIPEYRGDAAHALRERMIRSEIRGPKITMEELQRLTITAWEKFRNSAPVSILKPKAEFAISGWKK